jgi:hypothetical protein
MTLHASERFSERLNIRKNKQNIKYKKAKSHGYKINAFKEGEFKEWLSTHIGNHYDKIKEHYDMSNVLVYDNYLYIYKEINKKLITLYKVPDNFMPISTHLIKQKPDYFSKVRLNQRIYINCLHICKCTKYYVIQKSENKLLLKCAYCKKEIEISKKNYNKQFRK